MPVFLSNSALTRLSSSHAFVLVILLDLGNWCRSLSKTPSFSREFEPPFLPKSRTDSFILRKGQGLVRVASSKKNLAAFKLETDARLNQILRDISRLQLLLEWLHLHAWRMTDSSAYRMVLLFKLCVYMKECAVCRVSFFGLWVWACVEHRRDKNTSYDDTKP